MDLDLQSPSDNTDTKMAFRKPSNDAANRKYRRHSPVSGSSSSDGGAKRDRSSSPILSREDPVEVLERRPRSKDNKMEKDSDSVRAHYGRSGDSYGTRQSSRNSHGYTRQDDYIRHDKHASNRSSSRSGWESRGGTHSGHSRHGSGYSSSRHYSHDVDKYSRDKYDVTGHRNKDKDNEKSHLDRNKYKDPSHCRSQEYRRSELDSGRHSKEPYKSNAKEPIAEEERKKHDEWKASKEEDRHGRATWEDLEDKAAERLEYSSKKSKFSNSADEKQSSSSKKVQETLVNATVEQSHASNSDIAHDLNAAKVAAMKAAELVNKNLIGMGYLSTDQKKKLLWGSKKITTKEESGHHWDTALVGDQERQEKFNKLMGVKGDMKIDHKLNNQDSEKQKELQLDLEKQYTAGLRRRDGRTVGLGL